MPSSTVCREEHFSTEWHRCFAQRLGLGDVVNRKAWEFTAITAALDERGMLQPGRRGLGFAVGREPLSSYFAACGVDVLATDLGLGAKRPSWTNRAQHADTPDAIHFPSIVDRAIFDERVAFRAADMRKLDDDLGVSSYDFLWSACAFEHLGSLRKGTDFVRDAMRFLKPGGLAVHTTEYNVSSNTKTVTRGPAVVYRRRDLEELDYSLRMLRCGIEKIDFDAGTGPRDLNYDEPLKTGQGRDHIKLAGFGVVFTSVLLVIRKG
ncbi:MAG TPA: class I SAM-dependent methyltransferase [Bosea sp. (in: a-proteobacteria)]|jgi:SAM-dependent methyltransferase|uniref:SAM-dependent methyltransferase n=1 Tax=Bosea sp. (in: a-proteobacteria) TaxID=1871050 RepID=UPI002E0DF637|nr:class I SAM-dependent methyltransferase [Bosea sp. (in: a-proteobacteria)]